MSMDRRRFLQMAGLAAAALSLERAGLAGGSGLPGSEHLQGGATMVTHELPALPYGYDALEPYYDEQTVRLHHDVHHAGYVNNWNAAEKQVAAMVESGDFAGAKAAAKALAFNGSGAILHEIFWTNMKPGGGGDASGALAKALAAQFGSVEKLRGLFVATANATEGSGWAILGYNKALDQLVVLQAEKHENFAQWGVTPLLVLDVWEHAYYLKYQNKRPEWTQAFMEHLVNWDDVAARYAQAKA